jgi:lambda repressor-like predicted transcriptional regulator
MTTEASIDASTKLPTRSDQLRANGSASDLKPAATKAATIRKLLTRTRGATMTELSKATGWQPHSLRAFMSGLRKSGDTIAREPRKSGEQAYRLVSGSDVSVPGPIAGDAPALTADSGAAASELA